jgi:acetyltransferase-like isoleucine patch superfamily enzyme
MSTLKSIAHNPLTAWLKWLAVKVYYESTHSAENIRIGYMAKVSKSTFGRYATVYERAVLSKVALGDFSYVGPGSRLNDTSVGKFSCIASDVLIGLGSHPSRNYVSIHPAFFSPALQAQISFASRSYFDEDSRCAIGNDVWIGARAMILNGLTIGDGAIVGAGAVVTKNVPAYAVVAGVPAKVVRYRFEPAQIAFLTQFKWWDRDVRWLQENFMKFHDINLFSQAMAAKDD